MPLKYWSVQRKGNYGHIGVLAETPEAAVRIAHRAGYTEHDKAKRLGYSGNCYLLPSGEYLANVSHVGTDADPRGNTPLGWTLFRQVTQRGFQHEVVRFISEDEAMALHATRIRS